MSSTQPPYQGDGQGHTHWNETSGFTAPSQTTNIPVVVRNNKLLIEETYVL